jgi:hypothetical protein
MSAEGYLIVWKKLSRANEDRAAFYLSLLESPPGRKNIADVQFLLSEYVIDTIHLVSAPVAMLQTEDGSIDLNQLRSWLEDNGDYVGP